MGNSCAAWYFPLNIIESVLEMNGSSKSGSPSNSVAILALASLLPIFIFVIANGWQSILSPVVRLSSNETVNLTATWISGIIISLVAVILAWAVAIERARLRDDKTARFTWIAYLGVLIVVSALGTMNWMFKGFEATNLVKEATEETLARLTALDQFTKSSIKLTDTEQLKAKQSEEKRELQSQRDQLETYYKIAIDKANAEPDRFKNKIMDIFATFAAEVKNPLKEGCGEVARGYLAEIKALLPDLRLPSGDCASADPDVMLGAYQEAVEQALARWGSQDVVRCDIPEAWQVRVEKIRSLTGVEVLADDGSCAGMERTLRALESSVENYIAEMPAYAPGEKDLLQLKQGSLEKLNRQIKNVKALYLDGKMHNKDAATPILKDAWSEYNEIYTRIGAVVDVSSLPSSIVDQRIDKIGNIGNTIEILISRYNHISTYPIVFAAIIFDVILIAFFFRVVVAQSTKKHLSGHAERLRKIRSSLNEI